MKSDAAFNDAFYYSIITRIEVRALPKLKTPDAIIAATAIVYNHTLLSRNLSDFKNIPGLKVIDPHTL